MDRNRGKCSFKRYYHFESRTMRTVLLIQMQRWEHSWMDYFGSYLWVLTPPPRGVLLLLCWCLQWRTVGSWHEQLFLDPVLLFSPCWDPQHPSQEPWKDCLEVNTANVKHCSEHLEKTKGSFSWALALLSLNLRQEWQPRQFASQVDRSVMMVLLHHYLLSDSSSDQFLAPQEESMKETQVQMNHHRDICFLCILPSSARW